MCSNFFSTATNSLDTIFLFRRSLSCCVLFWLIVTFAERCASPIHSSCSSFIYFYSLRSLSVHTVRTSALCLHTYSRFVFVRQCDSKSLFTNFIMLLNALGRSIYCLSEWNGYNYCRKRQSTSCARKKQAAEKCATNTRRQSAVYVSKQNNIFDSTAVDMYRGSLSGTFDGKSTFSWSEIAILKMAFGSCILIFIYLSRQISLFAHF